MALSDLPETAPGDPPGPRFLVEDIYPSVDGGRHPIKRIAGEVIEVWADLLREGHASSVPSCCGGGNRRPIGIANRCFWPETTAGGRFTPPQPGRYLFAVESWTDRFATWRKALVLKREAGLGLALDAQEGRELIGELKPRDPAAKRVIEHARRQFDRAADVEILLADDLAEAVVVSDTRPDMTRSTAIPVVADRERARAGAWYEMVPRSQGTVPGRPALDDCIARLPEIAALGFDVVYLTPIHPIGMTNRKGKNNSLTAGPDDPGSPYAIEEAWRPRRRASRTRHARHFAASSRLVAA